MRLRIFVAFVAAVATVHSAAQAVTVAQEDFDGGDINLTSSMVPTLDGGGGDTFAVGATEAWPTTGGTPFSITDNSVGDVGDTMAFPGDTEGIFGVNSDFTNRFLGISDSDEFGLNQTANWTFDISGFTDLAMSIDMGSMEGSSFSYGMDTFVTFTASIDGGASQTVLDVRADPAGDGYAYRALDDGVVIVANDNALSVSGDNTVTKILADTGLAAMDTFLDKTPATGNGQGLLDTYSTALNGSGSELVLTLVTDLPFEAIAIDNIRITGVPEPAGLTILVLSSLLALGLRRR